jgi:hypothetical protein
VSDDGWCRRVSTSLEVDSIESGYVRSKLTDLAYTRRWASDGSKSQTPHIRSISQSGGLLISSCGHAFLSRDINLAPERQLGLTQRFGSALAARTCLV